MKDVNFSSKTLFGLFLILSEERTVPTLVNRKCQLGSNGEVSLSGLVLQEVKEVLSKVFSSLQVPSSM